VVKVGGKRFSTVEVEQALRTMPGVAEAAVFAHARFGEPAIAAALVPEPGSGVDDQAARAFQAARLAPFKLPRTIVVLSALPKGSNDCMDPKTETIWVWAADDYKKGNPESAATRIAPSLAAFIEGMVTEREAYG
jgi:non-ribosomal peptide synthetase component E (peptide arylation enzyme)